jgi:hypothetical protein
MANHILRQVRQAVEQLNPNDVRAQARRKITVRLAARDQQGYETIERFLSPPRISAKQCIFRVDDPRMPDESDIDIVESGMNPPADAFVFDSAATNTFVSQVLTSKDELSLSLARTFPVFYGPVTDKIIASVSKENAVFAIMTAIPSVAPGLSIPWAIPEAVSDTSVLTVNQLRMAFLLAAAADRPIGYGEQKAEVAGIIAGSFGFRALARELSGKIPFGGGIIPKAAIAYAGTWVEGRSLERLYRTGQPFSRSERRIAYREALARGREVAASILDLWRKRKASPTEETAFAGD